jgi:hypothetical protein
MRAYLSEKYKWDTKIIDQIWWEIHGKALWNLNENNRSTIQKFIHERLPCNYRENKYYGYRPPYCRVCRTNIETNEHILQCSICGDRKKIQKDYLRKLQATMIKLGTNECTIRVLIIYL